MDLHNIFLYSFLLVGGMLLLYHLICLNFCGLKLTVNLTWFWNWKTFYYTIWEQYEFLIVTDKYLSKYNSAVFHYVLIANN